MKNTNAKTPRNPTPTFAAIATVLFSAFAIAGAPPAAAYICVPGVEGDADCDVGPDCPSLDLQLEVDEPSLDPLCDDLSVPLSSLRECEPSGTMTAWVIKAGFESGGLLDKIIATAECYQRDPTTGDETIHTIAGCTADFFVRQCTHEGFSRPGLLRCRLTVIDNFDGVAVVGAYVSCVDPVDPLNVLPVVNTVNDAVHEAV